MRLIHPADVDDMAAWLDPEALQDWLYDAQVIGIETADALARLHSMVYWHWARQQRHVAGIYGLHNWLVAGWAHQQRLRVSVRYAASWMRHEAVLDAWWAREVGEVAA